eukprot:490812_1
MDSFWMFIPSSSCQCFASHLLMSIYFDEDNDELTFGGSFDDDVVVWGVDKKISAKQLVATQKQGHIYLCNVGECPVFVASLNTQGKQLDKNVEMKLENGAIIDIIDSTFCRLYVFNIYDIDEDPLQSIGADEREVYIEQNENVYHLNMKNKDKCIDGRIYNKKSLPSIIYNEINKILPMSVCKVIADYCFVDISQYIAYCIGKNTSKTKTKKSTRARIHASRTTTHYHQATDHTMQVQMKKLKFKAYCDYNIQ